MLIFTNRLKNGVFSKLLIEGVIKSEKVLEVMKSVDRGDFVSSNPYMDTPQSLGYSATISAPHMHIFALVSLLVNKVSNCWKTIYLKRKNA